MRYKEADVTPAMLRLILRVAGMVYGLAPVYLVAVEMYRHPAGSVAGSGYVLAGIGLFVMLALATYRDYRIASRGKWTAFHPVLSFVQVLAGLAVVTLLNLGVPDTNHIFRPMFLLPLLVAAVMGDTVMVSAVWGISVATLCAVEWHETHQIAVVFWQGVVSAAVWATVAGVVHVVLVRVLVSMRTAEALAALAAAGSAARVWPNDVVSCMRYAGIAMGARSVALLAPGAGGAMAPIAAWTAGDEGTRPAGKEAGSRLGSRRQVGNAKGGKAVVDMGAVEHARRLGVAVGTAMARAVPVPNAAVPDVVLFAERAVRRPGRRMAPEDRDHMTPPARAFDLVSRTREALRARPSDTGAETTVAGLVGGVAERAALVRNLEIEARTDALTGIANRRALFEGIERDLVRARRAGEPLSLIMFDLDHFKEINDRYGHEAGDAMLVAFVRHVSTRIRAADVLARYGGEEFCLVLPGTDAAGAERLTRSLYALGEMRIEQGVAPAAGDGGKEALTFSAGLAEWDGDEAADSLLRRADRALYAAKEAGRDTFRMAG